MVEDQEFISSNLFGKYYILAMGAENAWGKLQNVAKLVILRALVSGSNSITLVSASQG